MGKLLQPEHHFTHDVPTEEKGNKHLVEATVNNVNNVIGKGMVKLGSHPGGHSSRDYCGFLGG